MSEKRQKLNDRMMDMLNGYLRAQVKDPRLQFVSITSVQLNPDNSHAKVYWDTFDSSKKESIAQAFESLGPRARTFLAKGLKIRHVPGLSFHYDSQYEDQQAIEEILAQEKAEGKFEDESE